VTFRRQLLIGMLHRIFIAIPIFALKFEGNTVRKYLNDFFHLTNTLFSKLTTKVNNCCNSTLAGNMGFFGMILCGKVLHCAQKNAALEQI